MIILFSLLIFSLVDFNSRSVLPSRSLYRRRGVETGEYELKGTKANTHKIVRDFTIFHIIVFLVI